MTDILILVELEDYKGDVFRFALGHDSDLGEEITKLFFDNIEGYYYITSYFKDGRAVNKFLAADIKQLGLGYSVDIETVTAAVS